MTKKFISIILSIIMCALCMSSTVTASIIEPKIVKTETWGGYYYITGAPEEQNGYYPYLTFRCDIYSDATIRLCVYNNHDWNSFVYDPSATVRFMYTDIPNSESEDNSSIRYYTSFSDYFLNLIGSQKSTELKECCENEVIKFRSTRDISEYVDTVVNIKDQSEKTAEAFLSKPVSVVKSVGVVEQQISDYDIYFTSLALGNYSVNKKINNFAKIKDDGTHEYGQPTQVDYKRSVYIKATYVDVNGKLVENYSESNTIFGRDDYTGANGAIRKDTPPMYIGLLGNLPVGEENPLFEYELYPNSYPKEDRTLLIAGHELKIDRQILIGGQIESESDPREQYIKQLESEVSYLQARLKDNTSTTTYDTEYIKQIEEENKNLKEQLANTEEIAHEYANRLTVLTTNSSTNDINNDGVFSIDDVQYLLMYYTESVVAKSTTDTIDVWYVNRFGKE